MIAAILITKNNANTIEKTLYSLINQKSLPNYQILVFDKGSTDETVHKINTLKIKYPKLIKVLTNKNVCDDAILDYCINYSNCDKIVIVDPNSYVSDLSAFYFEEKYLNTHNGIFGVCTKYSNQDVCNYGIINNEIICTTTMMFRKEYLTNGFPIMYDNISKLNMSTVITYNLNNKQTKAKIINAVLNPKVSVIIPVYNTANYLSQCIESILNQTLKEIEIICVDDGSTDESVEILSKYAQYDKRIKILIQNHSSAGAARNLGMSVANGEYLYFIDSDDWIERNLLQTIVDLSCKNNADVCSFGGYKYDDKTKAITSFSGLTCTLPNEVVIKQPKLINGEIFSIVSPNCWSKLFKRSFIEKHQIKYQPLQNANDVAFVYNACCLANKIVCLNKPFIYYRNNTIIQTSNKLTQYSPKNIYDAFNNIKEFLTHNKNECMLDDSFYKRYINSLIYQKRKSPLTFDSYRELYMSLLPKTYKGVFEMKFGNMNDNTIPIVFATNDNYASHIPVVIKSIIENNKSDSLYNIYVFYTKLSQKNKDLISQTETDTVSITLINVSSFLKKAKLYSRCHYSIEMYYRALIPSILTAYDKVIYLDCDVIVTSDLKKLYDIDIMDAYVGAVQNIPTSKLSNYIKTKLKINDNEYFNSGVLLINNHQWKQYDLTNKFFNYINGHRTLLYPDQDTLNLLCNKHVYYLPLQYNLMWQFFIKECDISEQHKCLLNEAKKNHSVIHYSSKYKPWDNESFPLAEEWWKYYNLLNNKESKAVDEIESVSNIIVDVDVKEVEKPKFSIIIPVYNMEKYLYDCINSVLLQDFTSFEIICINDGSTDNSLSVLNKYKEKYNNIKVITQINSKQGKARNEALKIAKGDYVWFIDADDKIKTNALSIINDNIDKYNADMVCFEACNFYEDGKMEQSDGQRIKNVLEENGSYLTTPISTLKQSIPISACLFVIKREILNKYNIRFSEYCFFEDNIFLIKCLHFIDKISYEKKQLYLRRKHDTSTTAHWENKFDDYLLAIRDIYDFFNQFKITNDKKINNYCISALNKYMSFDLTHKNKYKMSMICTLFYLNKYNEFGIKYFGSNPYMKELSTWWYQKKNRKLDFNNIKTIGEAIQWIKLNDSTSLKSRLADKLKVRDYISKQIGDEYLVPIKGVYGSFDEIDFSQFEGKPIVLKCNHGSGWNHIVLNTNSYDADKLRSDFNRWMSKDYAACSYELHYSCIPRRIIAEEYISPELSLFEIQVYCINSIPSYISVETIKDADIHKRCIFDVDGNELDFMITPQHYDKLDSALIDVKYILKCVELTKKIVINTPFARYDFIQVNDDIKFREITFTSGSGLSVYEPEKYDYLYGSMIKLNKN